MQSRGSFATGRGPSTGRLHATGRLELGAERDRRRHQNPVLRLGPPLQLLVILHRLERTPRRG